jgi:spermidine/putrescine transport system permease protein
LWLVLLYVVPTLSMLSVSLQEGSLERGYRLTWHWATYWQALTRYDGLLVRSAMFALVATVLCLAIGYPLAYAIAFRAGAARNTLLFLVILPFFVSLIIRTLSWKFVLGDQGFVLSVLHWLGAPSSFRVLNTPGAVIGGLVYNYLPFMALPLYVALERIDPRILEASADLYGSSRQTFRRVTVPMSMPGIVAGTLLTFVPAAGDYIQADLLGGPGQLMIGNAIQRQFLVVNDYPVAAALSFVLLAGLLVSVVVYARVTGVEELVA